MATINMIKNNKSAVEIRSELKANGTKIEYIIINGKKVGILGSTSEADRKKAIETLSKVYTDCNGNISETMKKLREIAELEEKEGKDEEIVRIFGENIKLSYSKRKAYDMFGDEIANCNGLPTMPKEVVKALLIAKAELVLK